MRPIDADALPIFGWPQAWEEGVGIARCCDAVQQAPTLDVVPVIRCTQCKYYGPGDHAGFWRCENWGVDINRQASPPETFYCADGETKEEET